VDSGFCTVARGDGFCALFPGRPGVVVADVSV
jgi:hypothetical protein